MKNTKANCIFDYEGFVYVIDFEKMLCWVINEEDDPPTTTLDIMQRGPKDWYYRIHGINAEFVKDDDRTWCELVRQNYEQFLNKIIVGQNARSAGNRRRNVGGVA